MSQAVPIQTEIAQVYQGQIAGVSGNPNNSPINQTVADGKATFDDVMASQLKGGDEHVDVSSTEPGTEESGNVLPVDGKYFPPTSLNTPKQPGLITILPGDSSIVLTDQKAVSDQNIHIDLQTDPAVASDFPGSLPDVNVLPGVVSQGAENSSYSSRDFSIEASGIALTQEKIPVNHNSDGHVISRYADIDSTTLKSGQSFMTDSRLLNTSSMIAGGGDSDTVASSVNLDRNIQSDINAGISSAIRQYLNLKNDTKFSGLHKGDNIALQSRTLSQQLDGQNIGTFDGYTAGLHQTGQSLDQRSIPVFQMNQPVTSSQWNNEFADRVRWLVSGNIKKAEISLVPKNLGTIDISISVHNDQTNISINAHNLQSKEAIEGSLARLREMFNQAGIGNVNVDISQHSDRNAQSFQSHVQDDQQYNKQDDEILISPVHEIQRDDIRGNTLIDLYA